MEDTHEFIEFDLAALTRQVLEQASPGGISPWFYGSSFAEALGKLAAWERQIHAGGTCWEVLGIPPGSSPNEIRTAYRRMAKDVHPDLGGSEAAFIKLNDAFRQAMAEALGETNNVR